MSLKARLSAFTMLWMFSSVCFAQYIQTGPPSPIGGYPTNQAKLESQPSHGLYANRQELQFLLDAHSHFYDAAMDFTPDDKVYSLEELMVRERLWGLTLFDYFLLSGNIATIQKYLSTYPVLRLRLSTTLSSNFNFISNFFNVNQAIRKDQLYTSVDIYLSELINLVHKDDWFKTPEQSDLTLRYYQNRPTSYSTVDQQIVGFPHEVQAQGQSATLLHSVTRLALKHHLNKLLDAALTYVKANKIAEASKEAYYYAYIYQSIATCHAQALQKVSSSSMEKYWHLQISEVGNFAHLAASYCLDSHVFQSLASIAPELFHKTNDLGFKPSFYLFENKHHVDWSEPSMIETFSIFIDQTDQNPLTEYSYDQNLQEHLPNVWKLYKSAFEHPIMAKSIGNILLHFDIQLKNLTSLKTNRSLYDFIALSLSMKNKCWFSEKLLGDLLFIQRYTDLPIHIRNGSNQNILHLLFSETLCSALEYEHININHSAPYAYEDLIEKYYGWFFKNAGFTASDLLIKDDQGKTPMDYLNTHYTSREVDVMTEILTLNGLL